MSARAASSTPVIAIRNLTVWGTPKPILKDVNWTVNPGEHWAILGANGSGKTSVLGALTGYLTPGAGDIAVMGHTYGEYDWRELRKSIGIVSANVRNIIHDDNSALEIVATGKDALLHYWGDVRPAEKRAARALLKQVECERLEDRPWWVLSQGERQRVLIARALMAKPKLLILDEPCAGLDPVARENFLAFVGRLAGDAKAPTLVLVTHHVEEILPAFTHTLLLRDGGVIAAGPKQEILRAPLLSKTFGAPVRLASRAGRYTLAVKANRNVAV